MIFSSMVFLWIFLPIAFVVYWIIGKRYQNIFLLLISLFFYAWGEPVYVLVMLFSVLLNYICGLLIEKTIKLKKMILIATVISNLLILGYYKYFAFLAESIASLLGSEYTAVDIELPIGISFFTFQAMSYVIDLYRGEYKAEKKLTNVALYISFFPQLIAGPIVKYKEIGEQIKERSYSLEKCSEGIRRFMYGLSKKIILSNILAEVADTIFSLPIYDLTSVMAWIGTAFYTLQIYYDFSGYSDMAIGLGKMFGFEINENFNYPYLSSSIREFWQRWHISLGTWFREYVYIPLGGNRKGELKTYRNLMFVFFLTGLWHGASWNFVIWGIYHGIFQLIERVGLKKILMKHPIIAHLYTIMIVSIGWVFFKIENIEVCFKVLQRMVRPWEYVESSYSLMEIINLRAWIIFGLAIVGCGIIQKIIKKYIPVMLKWKGEIIEIVYCTIITIYCFMLLAGNTYNPFIYFRF